jgi:hypothetical protein
VNLLHFLFLELVAFLILVLIVELGRFYFVLHNEHKSTTVDLIVVFGSVSWPQTISLAVPAKKRVYKEIVELWGSVTEMVHYSLTG